MPRPVGRGEAARGTGSALAGAAVTLFKDQIVQIGAGIVTAVHGFTFFPGRQSALAQCRLKCYLTVYASRSKKSDVFS